MKVLIISGGISPEKSVSWKSAKAVKKSLEDNGYKVKTFDLKAGLSSLKKMSSGFDVIFPVLHGEEGEGGELQKYLEELKKPYVGGSYKGFKQGWHKIPFKCFCKEKGITTAEWREIKKREDLENFGFPSVLKSSNGGSSKEVVILKSLEDLKTAQCKKLLNSGLPLFVERYLEGVEVTVGILGEQALPVIEIRLPQGKWFDYKNKYSGSTEEIPDAPSLNKTDKERVQELALEIHKKLDLGPYSRIDFIVFKGEPYVLEVNTIPGLTNQSLFPKAALATGITFKDLTRMLVEMSILA